MGAWQIISPVRRRASSCTSRSSLGDERDLHVPTVLVAGKVGGDEEIPAGAVAVLTTCSVDVLSHTAVRRATAARSLRRATTRRCSTLAAATASPCPPPSWAATTSRGRRRGRVRGDRWRGAAATTLVPKGLSSRPFRSAGGHGPPPGVRRGRRRRQGYQHPRAQREPRRR